MTEPAPLAYEGLDRVFHERARLGVLTSLAANPKGLAFSDLRRLCGLTDGNLNRHLLTLQEAGLVEVSKSFERNRPLTLCRITPDGRARFLEYLEVLDRVVREAAAAAKSETNEGPHPGLAPA
jgi:DNA-binding MarR family transcriptional regulator